MRTGSKIILFLIQICAGFILISSYSFSQDVRVGLFWKNTANAFVFHCTEGKYQVFGDSMYTRTLNAGDLLYVGQVGDHISLMDSELQHGEFSRVEFRNSDSHCGFRLKLVDSLTEARNYSGRLELSLFFGSLQIINTLPMDDYIAGVVEAEGGPSAETEFYRAQAILCRSYAIKNWEKHMGEGYNLCDNIHCQVFKGISDENPSIPEAVLSTHGLVLVTQNYSLVPAIFHSNSGGETQRASDVWNSSEDYLQAVLDPFSEGQRSSRWEKSISLESWKNYLSGYTKIESFPDEDLMIKQEHRKKFFVLGEDLLRITDIRAAFNLKSTFFTMELKPDTVLIHGKGYGHGVGMSQEGAMEMARQGYSYSDILRFYFYNVRIMDISDLPASELPEEF